MPEPASRPAARPLFASLASLKAANVIVAVILVGFALWAMRRILEPFVLAVFLLLMIDGMARAITSRVPRFPARWALPTAVVLILAVLGLTAWLTVNNAGDFLSRSKEYGERLNGILDEGAQHFGMRRSPTVESLFRQLDPRRWAGEAASGIAHAGEGLVFMLIYLGFLLASRRGFRDKADALFTGPRERAEANKIFARIRGGVESYLWVQTVVGVIIAAFSGVILAIAGMDHIFFWCLLVFVANYVPAIGGAIGVLFPAAFALVDLDALWKPLALIVALEAVHFFVSHVVQPRMQGETLNVDPLVVLLSLTFWGAIWGVTGAFLSTPLTVVAMAILAEFPATRAIAVLLSRDGRPFPVADTQVVDEASPPPGPPVAAA